MDPLLFPVLNLPDLAFENVTRHLKLKDLILLATCSKRMRSNIQSIQRSRFTLEFYFNNSGDKTISLISDNDTFIVRTNKRYGLIFEEKIIAGKVWKVVDEDSETFTLTGHPCRVTLFWFEFLKNLFNCKSEICLKFTNSQYFIDLLEETDILHRADKISVSFEDRIPNSMLTHMLDSFHANELEIRGQASSFFVYDKLLIRFPVISISFAHWLSRNDAWKMIQAGICRQLTFHFNFHWTSAQLNGFLKKWLDSDNTTLEVIKTSLNNRNFQQDPVTVFQGINTIPGSKKREDAAKYFDKNGRYEQGWDIRRKDGLLATIVLEGGAIKESSFTVWYCLDPNVNDNN